MAVLNLRTLAGGRLLRGSQPFGLDAAATSDFLARHGIQAIMDLRSELERSMVPWLVPNGAGVPGGTEVPDGTEVPNGAGVPGGTEVPNGAGVPGGTEVPNGASVPASLAPNAGGEPAAVVRPAVELIHNPLDPNAVAGSLRAIETPQDLGNLYLTWIRARPEWVADALRPAAQGRRTLVHCSLGKDRTGVVSALALLAAGASEDDVVKDYTATTVNLPDMLQVMAETWRLHVPSTPAQYFSPELMVLQSPEAAIRHFLASFAREFGDARDFLREAGLTSVEVSALRD
ncbi:tyrosine-protein phosphatase [Paenarthrobacter sp. NPDC092416]|uniref:tyrosine-protein phosphatase n=1 Tax=Paenarthrobacter sp. NPDC092416 TaxID=3364386 RepID=UPI0038160AC3